MIVYLFIAVGESLSHILLFVTPRTAAHWSSLSFTDSWSLLKFISSESVMPFSHLILCCHLLLSPSLNLSQHQGLFQGVDSLHQVARVVELQLLHQSFQ